MYESDDTSRVGHKKRSHKTDKKIKQEKLLYVSHYQLYQVKVKLLETTTIEHINNCNKT